jgi:subtilisin-like proprotein convertase family protein
MRSSQNRPRQRWSWMSATLVLMVAALLLATPLSQMRSTAQSRAAKAVTPINAAARTTPTAPVQKDAGAQKSDASQVETLALSKEQRRSLAALAPSAAPLDTHDANIVNREVEPNNTPATAQPLAGNPVRVRADLFQAPFASGVDVDVYSFQAGAGDRVYAATMTGFSGGSTDTVMDILGTDGTTVLESDDEDGTISGSSSNIGGLVLPTAGTYYVRVRQFSTTSLSGTIRPYDLYVRVASGSPMAETEPNNNGSPQPLPANGFVSGAIATAGDNDTFFFNANAGDTIIAILDADPERDSPEWNPRLGIGNFNNFILLANGSGVGGTFDDANPSEALMMTVNVTGAYQIYIDEAAAGGAAGDTYTLSVSVIPGNARKCTSYAGTGGAIADSATTDFTLNIPDSKIISNLQVAINETHTAAATADLDVSLLAPDGNEVVLFDDPPTTATATAPQINLILDDEAAVPIGNFGLHSGMRYTPELYSRLAYFKGQQAQGTWTLRVRDDTATNTGTLNSWGINVCEDPSLTAALPRTVITSTDFEASDSGFTHSGTADNWARGLPSGASAPITTCHSGVNCWKTNLTGTYSVSSNQDLLSPAIDLTTLGGRQITATWWQKYQIESASFDQAWVEVREVGNPTNFRRLWEWKGATQTRSVGNPATTVQMSAGWGLMEGDISDFGGKMVELRFHLETDSTGVFSGLAIDDFAVSYSTANNRSDFDNDAKTDVSVWRPSSGQWEIRNSSTATTTFIADWGRSALGDIAVPGDFTGAAKTDVAVFRPSQGNWYILGDAQPVPSVRNWGQNGDIPAPADFDGDGKTDLAVFRGSEGNWYILNSASNTVTVRNWGTAGDKPAPADYDGDGKADIAVFRPSEGNWYIIDSFTGFGRVVAWGAAGDKLVPADYDGDRKADVAVFRGSEGNWYILRSDGRGSIARNWGNPGDIPVPGTYDADLKADLAVFRPSEGNWYILKSTDGSIQLLTLGVSGDVPVPSAYLPQ